VVCVLLGQLRPPVFAQYDHNGVAFAVPLAKLAGKVRPFLFEPHLLKFDTAIHFHKGLELGVLKLATGLKLPSGRTVVSDFVGRTTHGHCRRHLVCIIFGLQLSAAR
jgi:hypothetical protein